MYLIIISYGATLEIIFSLTVSSEYICGVALRHFYSLLLYTVLHIRHHI